MRNANNAFHIAIPCKDLDEAVKFYNKKLGCKVARRYHDRATFDFFGDQLVCHLSPDKIDMDPEPYPRHFGITFYKEADFNSLVSLLKDNDVKMLEPIFTRFEDMPERHQTFFLKDPSNNILEFKYYSDSRMMY